MASPRSVSGSVLYSFHITCQYFIDNRNIEFSTCVNTDASDHDDPHIDMCMSGQRSCSFKVVITCRYHGTKKRRKSLVKYIGQRSTETETSARAIHFSGVATWSRDRALSAVNSLPPRSGRWSTFGRHNIGIRCASSFWTQQERNTAFATWQCMSDTTRHTWCLTSSSECLKNNI